MNKCIVSLFRCFMFIFPKSSRDKHANIRGALGVKMSGRWRGGVTLWPDSPNIVRTADGKNLVYCSPLLSSTEPWLLTIAQIMLPKPQKHLLNDNIKLSPISQFPSLFQFLSSLFYLQVYKIGHCPSKSTMARQTLNIQIPHYADKNLQLDIHALIYVHHM